jgi:hypothetical protein
VGITVVVTGMISLLIYSPGPWKRKIQKSVFFGSLGFVPIIGWYIRNYSLTGSFTNRVLVFHPITVEKINQALLTILGWILPDSVPDGLRIVIAILVGIIILFGLFSITFRSGEQRASVDAAKIKPLKAMLLLYGIIYLIFLILSLTFFDSSTRLDDRILIPVYILLIIFTVTSINGITKTLRGRMRSLILVISYSVSALVIGNYLVQSWDLVQTLQQEGRGFASAAWRSSEIVAEIDNLGSDAIVYTNEAFAIYYLTDVGAYLIPEKIDPVIAQVRENFQPTMEKMRQRLAQPGSALAVFHQGYLREGMPTLEEIAMGLVIAYESNDGVIFVDPGNLSSWE